MSVILVTKKITWVFVEHATQFVKLVVDWGKISVNIVLKIVLENWTLKINAFLQ